MKSAEKLLKQELADALVTAQAERDKLWRLAANSFSILSGIRLTEQGMVLEFFGDVPPEDKIGLAPGTVPQTLDELLGMIHPEDAAGFRENMEHCLATGEPFKADYRLADGRGGWRWLEARALSTGWREGVHDYWLCDTRDITDIKESEQAVRNSLEELRRLKARLQDENRFLREEVDRVVEQGEIVGRSAPLTRVLEQVEVVAATAATVLISGETGTGKELIARAIHLRSERRERLFVAVNCAALPATLVESELFGHEKGAFTGAVARRTGRFEQADGGTLFLDEVGELPLEIQAKMLRVLQSGEFERVGGERLLKVNVRVIAASNRDLAQEVQQGSFRSDLYHRLAIFPIHLPPLRERREDIPLLAAYLVTQKSRDLGHKIETIPPEVLERLTAYDWPGNVRELENILERAIILSPGTVLHPASIQVGPAGRENTRKRSNPMDFALDAGGDETLQTREREHIIRICRKTGWKIKGKDGAAAILGINPGTLFARMKKLGIQRSATASGRAHVE